MKIIGKKSLFVPTRPLYRRLLNSVWLFPVILTIILLSLTVLKISGSSIGSYHQVFYGDTKDPSLLVNHPVNIRSDEWLVTTQLTIAQYVAGYPRVNPNIDSGRDMSVIGDAPYKDWSAAFRPQNLSFFVMPFENAFAFKWWFLLYMTIVSCYFFTLRIFKGKRLFATLFSLAISFSPFIFWWYTTGTMAPIFYGFFIILLSMRIINNEPLPLLGGKPAAYSQAAYSLLLGYLVASFALILYPPFQIPIAIAIAFFVAGLFINKFGLNHSLISKASLKRLGLLVSGIIIGGAIIFAFLQTRSNTVSAITNTVYPGKRTVLVEGNSAYEIFSTFLQPQLQRISRAANYYTNQSEASNFILFVPFLLIPGFALLFLEYKRNRKVDGPLAATQLCLSLFLLYLFVPFLQPLYKLLYLDKVANTRLFIGLGFTGAIQILLILKSIEQLKITSRKLNSLAAGYTLVSLGVLLWVGNYTRTTYPKFIYSWLLIGGLAVTFCAILFCFLSGKRMLGAILFLAFTLSCVFHIHPLYRGLGPYYNGALTHAIDKVSKPKDTWVNLDNLIFENAPLISNRDSISGIKPYPDLKFWRQVEGPAGDYYYNRYAHVYFSSTLTDKQLYLNGPDSFAVEFGCTQFVQKHVDYAMALHTLDYPCITEVDEVHYPAITFYLYKIHPSTP